MSDLIKIEGEKSLVRELHSKAILNTDRNEVSKYNRQKMHMEKNTSMAKDVEVLKQDIQEIKELLMSFIKEIK